ncbi:MAG: type II toxin-antitoxin system VapC family toxin [Actinomycetota bacterium]|nr:type II toxin-antitoxin system VapC family toxin [Actinomycetota bacterium]
MTVFADSSALVKLYADEAGSERIHALEEPLVLSELARVEVPAAIWRKQRMGELSAADAATLVAAFEADWFASPGGARRFLVIKLLTRLLDDAARLVAIHGLRAYDALQLAAALAARAADPECDTFAAFDAALRTSAAAQGLRLAPS